MRGGAVLASAVALTVGVAFVVWRAPGWGRTSEGFRLSKVDVRGNAVLTEEEVVALAGLELGDNLLAIDLSAVEDALAASPRVRRAQVSRLLPGRLLIRLAEKLPAALVETAEGRLVEVSDDLTVLPAVSRTPFVDLPVVTGTGVSVDAEGLSESTELDRALRVLRSARCVSPWLWMEISEVRIAPGSGLILYTVADGAEIRVGSGALDDDGLRRLSLVLADLRTRGVRAESIDLRFRDQAVVRLSPGLAGGRA